MNFKKSFSTTVLIIICFSTAFSQHKITTNLRVGAGVAFASGTEGIGTNIEVPVNVLKFLEISPSVSYARIAPNYQTDYGHRVYPDQANSITYNGKSNELGNSYFNKSSHSQLGIDLNLRIKPLALLKAEGKIDFAIGIGYGYKSGIDINETSMIDGNYWIRHRSWNSMEWNTILLDVNYKLTEKHKLGFHFNSYGGNDGYDQLGIHFITKL
jgi:hypothetical protein